MTKSCLSTHKKRIHVKTRYDCSDCQKSFSDPEWLKHHTKLTHQNYLNCKICEKLFPDHNELETHKKSHTDEDTKCDQCGKRFASIKHAQKGFWEIAPSQ